jgi:hypothetical protein
MLDTHPIYVTIRNVISFGKAHARRAAMKAKTMSRTKAAKNSRRKSPKSGSRAPAPASGVTPYLIVKDAAAAIAF